MSDDSSPGERLRQAMQAESPLQVVGSVNACCAKLAEAAGFRALYLSGAGVANASWGLPDLGMTTLEHVLEDARRITAATELPLLVDCDTGWESSSTIAKTVREMIGIGVAAIHLEDQADPKRCGHRPGKRLITAEQMIDRIKAAVDARSGADLRLMARTDAAADEGLHAAIERAQRYVDAGADFIFAEALVNEDQFRIFADSVSVPVLANMTEFGRSPLLSVDILRAAGIQMVLYPLTAFRAMNAAAALAYGTLRQQGTQADLLASMQTREELYELLDYHSFEQSLDATADNKSASSPREDRE